ncbi:MAG TPA: RNA polymerase sigma factor [Candidatus Limnocylindrales bacterium]|jgi:RNA polymerase sigma-70 factor (ECF subfamily)
MFDSTYPAFEGAYAAHRMPLFRWLVATTRDADMAEDVTQEAFIRLARELDAGRPPDNAGAWLHRVAANLVVSAARHRVVVDRAADRLPSPSEYPSPEGLVVETERFTALRAALAELSPVERQAVLLSAQGFLGSEIAARSGRSEAAVRTLICRTRAKLRARLSTEGLAA